MSVANITQARDEMLAVFKTAWDADLASAAIPVFYNDAQKNPPSDNTAFARVTVQHVAGEQASLAGATGQQMYDADGIITVQIFTLFGEGLTLNDQLVKVVQDAYRGATTPGGIWFRNVRVNEIGQDGDRFQTNVLIDFNYDEIN